VLAGRDPGVMACSGNPDYLFVGSASGTDVSVLNVYNREMIGLVDITQKPTFIAITPDNQYALVLDEQAGNVAVIHIGAIRFNWDAWSKKSGASLYTMLPVGAKPVQAVIAPRGV
jgi:DNA-binding beta-propeller fold protein YncE